VTVSHDVNKPQEALSEERIRLEIAYYEDRIAEIGWPITPHEWGLLNNYRTLACFRRKLLSALRDGRPHAWMDYPEATEDARPEGGARVRPGQSHERSAPGPEGWGAGGIGETEISRRHRRG
jgi:hypothetical protein